MTARIAARFNVKPSPEDIRARSRIAQGCGLLSPGALAKKFAARDAELRQDTPLL